MSAHTPGPWQADQDDRPGREWNIHIVQAANPDMRICFLTSNGPTEANARLIAAAPDLLAALQAMATWMPSGFAPQSKADAMDKAYAAIAKATGGK